jgi:hypothetical protein
MRYLALDLGNVASGKQPVFCAKPLDSTDSDRVFRRLDNSGIESSLHFASVPPAFLEGFSVEVDLQVLQVDLVTPSTRLGTAFLRRRLDFHGPCRHRGRMDCQRICHKHKPNTWPAYTTM